MSETIKAQRFSVYFGGGVYLGGVVYGEPLDGLTVPITGDDKAAALSFGWIDGAAVYAREAAIRICHVARRAGLRAWLVKAAQL